MGRTGGWRSTHMRLVEERDGNNTPLVTYTRGRDLSGGYAGAGGIGGLLARSHGYSAGNWSSQNFYHADGNGNVTALASSAGALQASYKLDPYGRYLSGSGTLASANAMRFSSKPWVAFNGSSTAGLYYYGYRFYDPYLQRWVNRDPIGELGGSNLYGFAGNAPLDRLDAEGHFVLIPWLVKKCTPKTITVGAVPLQCTQVENKRHITADGRCAYRMCVYLCKGGGYGDEIDAMIPQLWVRIQSCKEPCPSGNDYMPPRKRIGHE